MVSPGLPAHPVKPGPFLSAKSFLVLFSKKNCLLPFKQGRKQFFFEKKNQKTFARFKTRKYNNALS
jgi:hypothetical protein